MVAVARWNGGEATVFEGGERERETERQRDREIERKREKTR